MLVAQAKAEAQAKNLHLDLTLLAERLAALPALKDTVHLVIPYGLTGGRGIASAGSTWTMWQAPTGPPGTPGAVPQAVTTPRPSGAASTLFLRVYVLDLKAKQLLLEGRIGATASSSFMKVTALHELEVELGQKLATALLNPS